MRIRVELNTPHGLACGGRFGMKPYDFQRDCYAGIVNNLTIKRNHGMLVMLPVGSGKTTIMHLLMTCLFERAPEGSVERVMAIMAPNLIMNFKIKLIGFILGKAYESQVYSMREAELDTVLRMNIPYYDRLWLVKTTEFHKYCGNQAEPDPEYAKRCAEYCNEKTVLLMDEAHESVLGMKKMSDDQGGESTDGQSIYLTLLRCSKKAMVVLYTATPAVNAPVELFKLLYLVNNGIDETRAPLISALLKGGSKQFTETNCAKYVKEFTEYSSWYKDKVLYANKERLNIKYPPHTLTRVPVQLSKQYYVRMMEELHKKTRDVAHMNARQMALQIPIYVNDQGQPTTKPARHMASEKYQKILKDIEDVVRDKGNRIVIFSELVTSCFVPLRQDLSRRNIAYCTFSGEPADKRYQSLELQTNVGTSIELLNESARQLFQRGICHVILVSVGTGGAGVDLQNGTHVFFMHPLWSEAMQEQAIARVVRPGGDPTRDIQVHVYSAVYDVPAVEKQAIVTRILEAKAAAAAATGGAAEAPAKKAPKRTQGIRNKGMTGDEAAAGIIEQKSAIIKPFLDIVKAEGLAVFTSFHPNGVDSRPIDEQQSLAGPSDPASLLRPPPVINLADSDDDF